MNDVQAPERNETNVLLGGWSAFSTDINAMAQEAWQEATGQMVGVKYTPIAVSQQVVAGMNYRFICNAQVSYPGAQPYAAIVSIYQPLNGPAHVTDIHKLI